MSGEQIGEHTPLSEEDLTQKRREVRLKNLVKARRVQAEKREAKRQKLHQPVSVPDSIVEDERRDFEEAILDTITIQADQLKGLQSQIHRVRHIPVRQSALLPRQPHPATSTPDLVREKNTTLDEVLDESNRVAFDLGWLIKPACGLFLSALLLFIKNNLSCPQAPDDMEVEDPDTGLDFDNLFD